MEKEKTISSELFPIVYIVMSLRIILSISITLHFFNGLSWCNNLLLLQQSNIFSLSSTSCIMHCMIFHTIFYELPNKEAPSKQ